MPQPHRRRHRLRFRPASAAPAGIDWDALAVVATVILTGWGDCFTRTADGHRYIDTPTGHILYGLRWYARYTGRFLVKCLAVLTLPVSVWLVYRLAKKHPQEA